MPTAVLYNMQGAKIGDVELSAALFGAEVNKAVLHESVVNYLANQRQGTQSTKTRTEVAGGGKKPFRQKGTGRARQGSTRAPQWIKGGVALGPKPRDYSYTINKKVKKLAMISALSAKAEDGSVMVIDKLAMDEIKTKTISDMLKAMGVEGKALIVTNEMEKNVYLSARNIAGVKASYIGMLNVYDILNHESFIVAQDAVAKLEEVYA
ncbi:MAG: 50S ribosomal protein L4 [Clostridia bacterium]|nr:50S ribosomal protein L4 [Clostridia bacterium]